MFISSLKGKESQHVVSIRHFWGYGFALRYAIHPVSAWNGKRAAMLLVLSVRDRWQWMNE
jgi:hypothetical protein